eukprot:5541600-Pyramimonas_sp.AAC.1
MAEEVDPADAAPAGRASDDSIAADVACETGTPIDLRSVVTEALDLSPERRIPYRAEGVGSVKTSMAKILSAAEYLLAGNQNTNIKNLALRTQSGINLSPDQGPMRYR